MARTGRAAALSRGVTAISRRVLPPRQPHADSHRSRFSYPDGKGDEIATVLYALGCRALWTGSICSPPGYSRLGGRAKLGREDSAVGLRPHNPEPRGST